jgi:hypothetical protein
MHESPNTARLCFAAAASSLILGGAVAAARFPGGFDWTYTVVSHLASTSRNPDGGRWVSGSLLMAVAFLWPVTHHLHRKFARTAPRPRASIAALRIGLIGGALLLFGLDALDGPIQVALVWLSALANEWDQRLSQLVSFLDDGASLSHDAT